MISPAAKISRSGAKLGVHPHVATLVGPRPGGGSKSGRVSDPSGRHDGHRCVDVVLGVTFAVDQPDAGGAGLETLDGPGLLQDPDPRRL